MYECLVENKHLNHKKVKFYMYQLLRAIEYIHSQLLQQRTEGLATLLISEDLDEILNLSDRIAVMFDGEIMGVVENDDVSVEQLGLMMAGEQVTG